ncbi:formate dehydrogenase subunit gamma [Phenylobacterium sp.]|uniref:formate dehydrogenase subunit gamma n=1 Tax=Phenylobacterium sp. TaxID=1871053 RepID=UPI00301BB133
MNPSQARGWNADRAREIAVAHVGLEGPLLPVLHALQAEFGHVPPAATPIVAEALNLTRAEVHGVITFYHDFRETPAGRRQVKICRAEACQATGGEAVAAALLANLETDWGDTTPDGGITVEAVYCLGLCAVAPAALVDGEPVGRLTASRLSEAVLG